MSEHYILEGHQPVPCDDPSAWAAWFALADRAVKQTNLGDVIDISTVFLGLDHQWGDGPPLLFETMVFRYPSAESLDMDRYPTWDDAVAGHEAIVARWRARACQFGP